VTILRSRFKTLALPAILLIVLAAAGLAAYTARARSGAAAAPLTSRTALEADYGVRVNLVSLTAAGGLIDLRLKITDGEKARSLLRDRANFPALYVAGARTTLRASEEEQSRQLTLEDNTDMFVLFPNAGNAVKRGTAVSLVFGDVALEPIAVK